MTASSFSSSSNSKAEDSLVGKETDNNQERSKHARSSQSAPVESAPFGSFQRHQDTEVDFALSNLQPEAIEKPVSYEILLGSQELASGKTHRAVTFHSEAKAH